MIRVHEEDGSSYIMLADSEREGEGGRGMDVCNSTPTRCHACLTAGVVELAQP